MQIVLNSNWHDCCQMCGYFLITSVVSFSVATWLTFFQLMWPMGDPRSMVTVLLGYTGTGPHIFHKNLFFSHRPLDHEQRCCNIAMSLSSEKNMMHLIYTNITIKFLVTRSYSIWVVKKRAGVSGEAREAGSRGSSAIAANWWHALHITE